MPGSETILVVEDAPEIRKLVGAMLASQGYNCLGAEDGVDALRLLEGGAEEIHLVLTDLVMPRMTGVELARQVRQLRPEMRIVLMSGFSDDPAVRLFERSPEIFIPKPFTASTLCAKVRRVLDEPWTGLPDLSVPAKK